jgi:hypothetical protein
MTTPCQLPPRELRLQIARQRRRIDARLRAVGRRRRQLVSWRSVVRRYPGYATMVAAGAGLAFSAGVVRRRLIRWLGRRLFGAALDRLLRHFCREARRAWERAAEVRKPAPSDGGDRGPA